MVKTENESSAPATPQNVISDDSNQNTEKSKDILVNGDATLLSKTTKCDAAIAKILKTNKIMLSDLPSSDLSQLGSATERVDSKSVYRNRTIIKWGFFKTREELDGLLISLNPRGFRERSLRDALQLEYDILVKAIEKCPFRTEENDGKETVKTKAKKGGNRVQPAVDKSLYQTMEAFLEANLRDQILDIEDRIWQGSLGSIKVPDRGAWRVKVENGIYHVRTATTTNMDDTSNEEAAELFKMNGEAEPMEVDGEAKLEQKDENTINGDHSCDIKEKANVDTIDSASVEPVVNGTLGKPDLDADGEVEELERNRVEKVKELVPASAVPSCLELSKSQQSTCLLGSRSATPTTNTDPILINPITKELAHALLKVRTQSLVYSQIV